MDQNNVEFKHHGENDGVNCAVNYGTIINVQAETMVRIPSHISKVIDAITADFPEEDEINLSSKFEVVYPEEKLNYNNIIKYNSILTDYAIYYDYCDKILNTLDDSKIGRKSLVLRTVKLFYEEAKGELLLKYKGRSLNKMEIIRENSDFLIDQVKENIVSLVKKSYSCIGISEEEQVVGVVCFICYCFMKCKILEKPTLFKII